MTQFSLIFIGDCFKIVELWSQHTTVIYSGIIIFHNWHCVMTSSPLELRIFQSRVLCCSKTTTKGGSWGERKSSLFRQLAFLAL